MHALSRSQRWVMLLTDVGFVAYWVLTALHAFPPDQLFKDHDNPILQAWNWSFSPLDLLVSATGIGAVLLARCGDSRGERLAIVSLTLTSVSGGMVISFWVLRSDYAIAWWLPNLWLLVSPLPFLFALAAAKPAGAAR